MAVNFILASLSNVAQALLQLFSFNHAQCNAILQRTGTYIPNAYNPAKPRPDSTYEGLGVALVGVAVWTAIAWRAWRVDRHSKFGRYRYGLLVFVFLSFASVYLQLDGIADYVDSCRRLLVK
jgi:hypothetical protein